MSGANEAGEVQKPHRRGGRYLDSSRDLALREAALALLGHCCVV